MRRTLRAMRAWRNSHNRLRDTPAYTSEHDDRAQHLAAMHLLERRLDVVDADRLGHELLQRQPALQVQVDEQREVAAREAIAVPRRLDRAPPTENGDWGGGPPHVRAGAT